MIKVMLGQRTLRIHEVAERYGSSPRSLPPDSYTPWVFREGTFRWAHGEEMEATSGFLNCLLLPWQALKALRAENLQGIIRYSKR